MTELALYCMALGTASPSRSYPSKGRNSRTLRNPTARRTRSAGRPGRPSPASRCPGSSPGVARAPRAANSSSCAAAPKIGVPSMQEQLDVLGAGGQQRLERIGRPSGGSPARRRARPGSRAPMSRSMRNAFAGLRVTMRDQPRGQVLPVHPAPGGSRAKRISSSRLTDPVCRWSRCRWPCSPRPAASCATLQVRLNMKRLEAGHQADGRPGLRDLRDVLVAETDAVDQHAVVVEAAQPLEDPHAVLGLRVEALLEVRDEGPSPGAGRVRARSRCRRPTSGRRRSKPMRNHTPNQTIAAATGLPPENTVGSSSDYANASLRRKVRRSMAPVKMARTRSRTSSNWSRNCASR